MPRPNIKGKGLEESKVVGVRLNKQLVNEFERVCKSLGYDKSTLLERLIFELCCAQIKRHPHSPAWLIRLFKIEPPTLRPVTDQSRSDLQVKYGINKCEWCGSTDIRLTKDGLVCNKCGAVLKAYWETDDYYKGKYFQDR